MTKIFALKRAVSPWDGKYSLPIVLSVIDRYLDFKAQEMYLDNASPECNSEGSIYNKEKGVISIKRRSISPTVDIYKVSGDFPFQLMRDFREKANTILEQIVAEQKKQKTTRLNNIL